MTDHGYTSLQKALAILPKITSMLSFLGSSMIISQVLQSERNRRNAQQRLVCSMSCIDVTVSAVWFLTNFFVPPWSKEVAWASGNQASCNVQGFIVQLSIGAVFYNASLSLYYLLVIRYGFNEDKIRKLEPWMHAVPLTFGLMTAVLASILNLYNPANWDCWIAPHPPDCRQSYTLSRGEVTDCVRGDNATIYQWAFFFAPLWAAILAISLCMLCIYRFVRAQDQRMLQYDFRHSTGVSNQNCRTRPSRNTRQVWSQSILYVGAFFVTWVFPTISRLVQLCGQEPPMWLIVLSGCFIPVQGFFNALVYFRLRYQNLKRENTDKSRAWIIRRIIRLALCCTCSQEGNDLDHRSDGMDLEERLNLMTRLSTRMRSSFSTTISYYNRRMSSGVFSGVFSTGGNSAHADEHSMVTNKMRGSGGNTTCAVAAEEEALKLEQDWEKVSPPSPLTDEEFQTPKFCETIDELNQPQFTASDVDSRDMENEDISIDDATKTFSNGLDAQAERLLDYCGDDTSGDVRVRGAS